MHDYNEACPISMAASVICEKWTLQIVREMFFGSTRYSEIQKYIPNISPSLLRSRLRFLEDNGVIVRKRSASGNRYEYHLTPAGKSLAPVLTEMGRWGFRWASHHMTDKQNTVSGLVRDFASRIDVDELPSCNAVIEMQLADGRESATGFIHVQEGTASTCDTRLGFDTDVLIRSTIKTMTRIWYGELDMHAAIESGQMKVVAVPAFSRRISRWLRISSFTTDDPQIRPVQANSLTSK
jgi:DNA-binding HxlR family transcriptional regulator